MDKYDKLFLTGRYGKDRARVFRTREMKIGRETEYTWWVEWDHALWPLFTWESAMRLAHTFTALTAARTRHQSRY